MVIPAKRQVGNTARQQDAKPKLRVAAYCRVSTDSDEQATSYEAQVEHYTEFIQKNPEWEFAGIYADDGISGTNTKNRDEFNRMIEDCEAGTIDMIITKSISRFARNSRNQCNPKRFVFNSYNPVNIFHVYTSFFFKCNSSISCIIFVIIPLPPKAW